MRILPLQPVTPEAFAPYGALMIPPAEAGERALHSQWLTEPAEVPVQMHLNRVPASKLPLSLDEAERHPAAPQAFVPVDVALYVAVVVGDGDAPDLEAARAFLVPGSVGVVYAPGVWHASATVLEETGHFCVLMRRRNDGTDDVFATLPEPVAVGFAAPG